MQLVVADCMDDESALGMYMAVKKCEIIITVVFVLKHVDFCTHVHFFVML